MREFFRHPSLAEARRVAREDWRIWGRFLAFIVVIGFAAYSVLNVRDLTTELRSSIIESCEVNGNTQRRILRHKIRKEIRDNQHLPPKLNIGLSRAELEILIARETRAREREISELAPIDCEGQYNSGG